MFQLATCAILALVEPTPPSGLDPPPANALVPICDMS